MTTTTTTTIVTIPHTYQEGDHVPLQADGLISNYTSQILSRDYGRLAFCWPDGGSMSPRSTTSTSTGSSSYPELKSNIQHQFTYPIHMKQNQYCTIICQIFLDKLKAAKLKLHIQYEYYHNWFLDYDLPAATILHNNDKKPQSSSSEQRNYHSIGSFPVGYYNVEKKLPFIYNHINIYIDYNEVGGATTSSSTGSTPNTDSTTTPSSNTPANQQQYRIVGFAIEPMSIKHQFQNNYQWDGKSIDGYQQSLHTCSTTKGPTKYKSNMEPQVILTGQTILYTYDVIWTKSNMDWSKRWEVYGISTTTTSSSSSSSFLTTSTMTSSQQQQQQPGGGIDGLGSNSNNTSTTLLHHISNSIVWIIMIPLLILLWIVRNLRKKYYYNNNKSSLSPTSLLLSSSSSSYDYKK